MTTIGSNIASSSGVSNSRGPLALAIVSLSLKEHLANVERMIHQCLEYGAYDNATFSKYVTPIVQELRMDPFGDIKNLLSKVTKHFGGIERITPLHWAVLMNDRVMVHHILSSGKVDINASTHLRKTALFFAVNGGNYEIVRDLLDHKADAYICNVYGESAFGSMVSGKDSMFGILKEILANNVNIIDKRKRTALHHATKKGCIDVVIYLLNEKADVNLQDINGYTPLHYAVQEGFLDVVTLLLERNADVNAITSSGISPLHFVAMNGDTNIVSLLLKYKANVDAVDEYGTTPLFKSIKFEKIHISNLLIAAGANIHAKNKNGNNNLHQAIRAHGTENNMIYIVKYLQHYDVDANAKNSKGYSPFFAAVVEGHIDMVKELLQSKEKIKLMEECNGQTPIQVAFDNGHEHIKRALLEFNDVSRYVESLYRDRQVYVDAANAILVGAALIASVTFASWLQPPLGYTTSSFDLAPSSSNIEYVDVQHNVSLRAFWIFNTLSFYLAIGTVVFGARSVLPRKQMFIKDIVVKLHQNLLVTSILLACSVFCVIIAFGIAGNIVLIPTLKFQWYMIVPTIFGGLVCLVSLGFLFKSMLEDNLRKKKKEYELYS